eukprot:TRINITY_DN38147_c1_g2_i2.p1 TRINITY_DN38147_c1_g2~~TRINITY_DN38147_c1_g2_i2.p1  ORF type:complete len:322 (+),score=34.40 TRINITY_DN38147_c1_g2_i2:611-1576(+)
MGLLLWETRSAPTALTVLLMVVCEVYGVVVTVIIWKALTKTTEFVPGNAALLAGGMVGVTCAVVAVGMGMIGAQSLEILARKPQLRSGFFCICMLIMATALYSLIVSLVVVHKASKTAVDLAKQDVTTCLSAGLVAFLGSTVGLVACGTEIINKCSSRPHLQWKGMRFVVFNGLLGLLGLISAVLEMDHWPSTGTHDLESGLFLISSLGVAYSGYRGANGFGAVEPLLALPRWTMTSIICVLIGGVGIVVDTLLMDEQAVAAASQPVTPVISLVEVRGTPLHDRKALLGLGPVFFLVVSLLFWSAERERHATRLNSPPLLE